MAIQSLDKFPKGDYEAISHDDHIILLAGTRNGDIIKLEFSLEGTKTQFQATILGKNHSTQDVSEAPLDNRYLRMALHPQLPLMASVGRDKSLSIWNIKDNSILERYFLGTNSLPTTLKYNPDGTMLCVGFQDGSTKLYQSKITEIEYKREANGKLNLTLEILKPDLVQLEVIKVSDKAITVIDVEFSENGSYLAISYDYKKVVLVQKNVNEDVVQTKDSDGCFVIIFTHRDSINKVNYIGQAEEDNIMYIKKIEIKCPVLESKTSMDHYLVANQMSFSEDSRFILIYFMPKSRNQEVKIDKKDGVYILWDIQTNNNVNVKLWGSLEHKLASIKFPFQIWAYYVYLKEANSPDLIKIFEQENNLDVIEGLQIHGDMIDCTAIYDNGKIIFIGDNNGQLHIIKSIALNYPKNEIPGINT